VNFITRGECSVRRGRGGQRLLEGLRRLFGFEKDNTTEKGRTTGRNKRGSAVTAREPNCRKVGFSKEGPSRRNRQKTRPGKETDQPKKRRRKRRGTGLPRRGEGRRTGPGEENRSSSGTTGRVYLLLGKCASRIGQEPAGRGGGGRERGKAPSDGVREG